MPLADENTGVVDALGESTLEDLGLQSSLQEIFDFQSQHVIQPHAALVEHTDADKTTDQGVTLEESLGILGVEFEKFTCGTSDF